LYELSLGRMTTYKLSIREVRLAHYYNNGYHKQKFVEIL